MADSHHTKPILVMGAIVQRLDALGLPVRIGSRAGAGGVWSQQPAVA